MSLASYDQPEKREARRLALTHAVESLTQYRAQSPVITLAYFDKVLDYACKTIDGTNEKGITCWPFPAKQCEVAGNVFKCLHASRVGKREPAELSVLFLSGPNPTNDLEVLLELGVLPENIWAVEANANAYLSAVEELLTRGTPLKLYRGSLHQFFELVPQQFDIVYYDSCSPLFGGEPNTIHVLRELFLRQRLTQMSVLITNFSEANLDKSQGPAWAKRCGIWSFLRDGWEEFEEGYEGYWAHVEQNLPELYGRFTANFISELAGLLMPWWRVANIPGAKRDYYADEKAIKEAIRAKREAQRNPLSAFFDDSFPTYLRILELAEVELSPNDPMRSMLFDKQINGITLANAVRHAYFLRNAGDNFSETSEFNRKACNPEFAEVLETFHWFDEGARLFCDEPFPHLMADLMLGLYGYPYHTNVDRHRSWKYTAKSAPMYLDVFVMDQARYFYDMIPTYPFVIDHMRLGPQLVTRSCMDAIFKHTHYTCEEWFYGATIAGMETPGFSFHEWPERKEIKSP